MSVKPIPDGYHTVTPYLYVDGAAKAIEFYKKAFNARELFRMEAPGGKLGHAELQIGNSRVMLADEHPAMGAIGPKTLGGAAFSLMLYVEDCDALFKQAIAAGATEVRGLTDQFYGDRSGIVEDPFGHKWALATHKEDVPMDELMRRAKAMMPS